MTPGIKPTEAQLKYSDILHILSILGMALLAIGFVLYFFQIIESTIPPSELPKYWSMPVDKYIEATGTATGWNWLNNIGSSDSISFATLVYLSLVSVACFLAILPIYIKHKDKYYVMIVIVQILVLIHK